MKAQLVGKNKKEAWQNQHAGFATLEILIAFTVLILCMSAVIMVSFGNQSIAVDSQIANESIAKAQATLEKARADSRSDFALVNPSTTTETSGPLTFTKNLDVQTSATDPSLDLWTKRVTSTVTWQNAGRSFSTIFTTLLTNKEGALGGDTCSSVLSGDWAHPQIASYEFGKDLLVPSDTSSGFPVGDIDVDNGILYVVVNNSNGNNNPNFFKFDISNPLVKPVFLSSTDNNPSVKAGINAVKVFEDYAFLASANGANYSTCLSSLSCSQLHVIDSTTMSVVSRLKIPGVTGTSGQGIGNAIFYKDGIIYLGLSKTLSGPEFVIIDVGGGGVGGSPTNPVYMSGLSIGNGVNSIHVKDDYAYVASPNDQELKVVNISNPLTPYQVGQFNAPGGGGNNGNGKTIAMVGDILYFGRTLLTGNEFYILNKSNPETNLPILGSRDVQNTSGNNTSINGIVIRDYLIFLLTNDNFQVLKRDSAYGLTEYATPIATPGGSGTTIDCEGNYIYFASVPTNDKGYIAIAKPGS
ncbi:MAG: hypothetical protein AAB895_00440 [Patescibacteria group bacterium]